MTSIIIHLLRMRTEYRCMRTIIEDYFKPTILTVYHHLRLDYSSLMHSQIDIRLPIFRLDRQCDIEPSEYMSRHS